MKIQNDLIIFSKTTLFSAAKDWFDGDIKKAKARFYETYAGRNVDFK